MSELKINKISPRKGTTTTIADSGDSVTLETTTNAGTISTAGITGGTIDNTSGRISNAFVTLVVNWQVSDIKTAAFTAEASKGFFVNTTSGSIQVTLPASPTAGDVIGLKDYANTWDTNKLTIDGNGNNIQGSDAIFESTVEGQSLKIVYVDATRGWLVYASAKASDISEVTE